MISQRQGLLLVLTGAAVMVVLLLLLRTPAASGGFRRASDTVDEQQLSRMEAEVERLSALVRAKRWSKGRGDRTAHDSASSESQGNSTDDSSSRSSAGDGAASRQGSLKGRGHIDQADVEDANDTASSSSSAASSSSSSSASGRGSGQRSGGADRKGTKCDSVTRFALLTVALGPYYVFVTPFVRSVEKHFFADDPCVDVTVIVWTDKVASVQPDHRLSAQARTRVVLVPRAFAAFPEASLKRFHAYLEQEELLRSMDYLWHIDVDAEFIEPVGYELLVDGMFAVAHADSYYYDGSEVAGRKPDGSLLTMADLGVVRPVPAKMFQQWAYFDQRIIHVAEPPYDHNHNAAVPMDRAKYYFFGGVWGGRADLTCNAFRTLVQWIDGDLAHGYVPVVHDESYVNRYFAENPPVRVLTCAYMNPVLYWTHPWLFKNFVEGGTVPLLDPAECGRRHDNEYPIQFPQGWQWPCFDATEEDRLWVPRVWNLFKCNKRPCPRKPGREEPPPPADCTFCGL